MPQQFVDLLCFVLSRKSKDLFTVLLPSVTGDVASPENEPSLFERFQKEQRNSTASVELILPGYSRKVFSFILRCLESNERLVAIDRSTKAEVKC